MSDLNIKGHLSMASANIMWGLMSPAAKIAMSSTTIAPLIMVDMRVAGAAILFWISSLFFKHEHVPPKDLLLLAGAAMIGIVLNQGRANNGKKGRRHSFRCHWSHNISSWQHIGKRNGKESNIRRFNCSCGTTKLCTVPDPVP